MTPKDIFEAEKELSSALDWVENGPENLELVSNVDIDGVTTEGLLFRLRAKKSFPDENVTAQLEYQLASGRPPSAGPITRIDWRPFHFHNNKGKGPDELRFIQQSGSHHHGFELNWDDENGLVLAGNLPIAIPLDPDPASFQELLERIDLEFNLKNVSEIPAPPWEALLV